MERTVCCVIMAVVASFCATTSMAADDSQTAASQKVLDILMNPDLYDAAIRPSVNGNRTTAQVQTYLRDIDIDDINMKVNFDLTFRMIWNDYRLQYNEPGVDHVTILKPTLAWLPDAFFKNAITTQQKSIYPESYLRVFPNGKLIYSTRLTLKQSCPMDLSRFPHDTQQCMINVASYGYTIKDLEFTMAEDAPIDLQKNLHADMFRFENYETGQCNTVTATGEYSCVQVSLKIRRVFARYLMEWYIPIIFLVIVSWFGFLIPAEQFLGRLLLTLIPLITLASFNVFREPLAFVPYVRAIDVFSGISLTIIFGTVVYVIASYIRGSKEAAQKKSESPEEGEPKSTVTEETSGARRILAMMVQRADFLSRLALIGTYSAFLFVYFIAYCGTG
ncbi:glutamate-gated chloride channel-like [Homarus americanus]|uniref:Glutamate-gated chloride channel-like 11 n=1 Tax=Homarus americanus TaxID=6706 RepID=A0A8J5K262_HOMAM|nr:glutamate-gated chloride channel-like [Homarus americanus]KAG7168630.1 Glutamate-gated chloride channel-like 11 [Homarus americanus]